MSVASTVEAYLSPPRVMDAPSPEREHGRVDPDDTVLARVNDRELELWEEGRSVPAVEELTCPKGMVDVKVHRADARFGFLHDSAVAWHDDTLFAAWYNCPQGEMAGSSCIRGRRSHDGGRTWSEVEVIAADKDKKGVLYVPAVFLSHGGTFHAFVCNMTGADLVTRCEVYVLDEATDLWRRGGVIAGPFLPNSAPVQMESGDFIMAGRMASEPGRKPETPAVAISNGENVTAPWQLIPIADTGTGKPVARFPESTLWVDGPEVTAIVRAGSVFLSRDYGHTWRGPLRHSLPAEDSKLYAGTLSTGQRYLVWNRPDPAGPRRNLLVLAVSRPGGRALAAMWRLRRGHSSALQAGPQWSYPCAIEHDGNLYVIYTSEKKHSVMSIIPLRALAAPCFSEDTPMEQATDSRALALKSASAQMSDHPEAPFADMSPKDVRAYEIDVMRRIADLTLIPPKLNTSPLPEYDYDQLDYGMTIGIARTPKGRIWAAWVGGEDGPNAFMLAATSDDDGETWSKPRLVIDSRSPKHPIPRSVIVGNLWTDPQGRLWFFFDQTMRHFDGRGGLWAAICSNPDAEEPVWSEPRRLWHGCSLNKPTVLSSGEWMLPAYLLQNPGYGQFAGIFPELDPYRGVNVFVSCDQGTTWERRACIPFPNPDWHEPMVVELKDGRLWMLARTAKGVAETYSEDKGFTWSEPVYPTRIQHPNARFHLRRLASGRILLVKHGDTIDAHEGRCKLTAWLSEDEGQTWQGGLMLDERKVVTYPDGFQAPDGTLYISYDRNRHPDGEILMARFTEADILARKLVGPKSKVKMLISRPLKGRK